MPADFLTKFIPKTKLDTSLRYLTNRNTNRIAGTDFAPGEWSHVALFDEQESRIEMHLEATADLVVRWEGGERRFVAGERIHTENSYKYTLEFKLFDLAKRFTQSLGLGSRPQLEARAAGVAVEGTTHNVRDA